MRQRTLTLTGSQRDELLRLRDHDPRPYVRERCAAVLLIAGGASPHAVAASRLLRPRDPDTVYAWLNRYQAEGLPGLTGHAHGGDRRRPFRGHRGRG
jgi:transposase